MIFLKKKIKNGEIHWLGSCLMLPTSKYKTKHTPSSDNLELKMWEKQDETT